MDDKDLMKHLTKTSQVFSKTLSASSRLQYEQGHLFQETKLPLSPLQIVFRNQHYISDLEDWLFIHALFSHG